MCIGACKIRRDSMTTETGSTAPVSSIPTGIRGLWESLLAPERFFAEIKQKPALVIPWIALALIFLATFIPIMPLTQVLMEERMQEELARQGMQGEKAMGGEKMMMFGLVFGLIGAAGVLPLCVAGLLMFFGNFVFAGKATFAQLLSASLFGLCVHFLCRLIDIPLVLASENIFAGLSLGVFAPQADDQSVLYVLLSQFSLANVAQVWVTGVAMQQIYSVQRNKGLLIAVASIGTLALLHIGSTAVSGLAQS